MIAIGMAPMPRFALTALAWSLALFAALRLSWIDLQVVGWLIAVQRDLALWYGATPTSAVVVDASCSGADVIALCVAVIFAYPASWTRRLIGAAGGTLLILALNTIRIGTLLSTASRPELFQALHIYVWPALLMVAMGVYVLLWTRHVGRQHTALAMQAGTAVRRFGYLALGLLGLHAAAAPWTMTNTVVARVGTWTAVAAERVLAMLGVAATATGNVLATSRGAFQVTQECLLTPLVPIYLAAALALPMRAPTRVWMLLLALPIFFVLGVLRVLVLALPPAIASTPLFLAHGFYQFVAGAAILAAASAWTIARGEEPARRSQVAGRTILAAAGAVLVALVAGDAWRVVIMWTTQSAAALAPHALTDWTLPGDTQGALALLPGFQLGLICGLWLAVSPFRRGARFVMALGLLAVSQMGLLVALGEAAARAGMTAHPLLVRAWAIAVPVALAWLSFRSRGSGGNYAGFWHGVGGRFPDLGGAASTGFYRDNEIRLLSAHVTDWRGVRVLKTDLWDEARNTRILQWAAAQGAEVFGIDISEPTLRLARSGFERGALRASLADVRRLPFAGASFDVIYSMGTIEHFDESEAAVVELVRVLKPGGRLILGVPNRFDPFLRPVLVWWLWSLGLYGYGFEKSYSRPALRRMIERAGLDVIDETGILFIPGWLRMADLWAHTRAPFLAGVTRAGVRLFAWLDRRFPGVRRHGYLLASVGTSKM